MLERLFINKTAVVRALWPDKQYQRAFLKVLSESMLGLKRIKDKGASAEDGSGSRIVIGEGF